MTAREYAIREWLCQACGDQCQSSPGRAGHSRRSALTAVYRRRAVRFVAGSARDAGDAALILEALGLEPVEGSGRNGEGGMSFWDKVLGDPNAVEKHRQAREALEDHAQRGEPAETDEFHRLNDGVLEAEKDVPWWRR